MKNRIGACLGLTFFLCLQSCSEGPIRRTYESEEDHDASSASLRAPNADILKQVQALYQKGEYQRALSLTDNTPEEKIRLGDQAQFFNLKGLCLLAVKRPLMAEAAFRKSIDENRKSEFSLSRVLSRKLSATDFPRSSSCPSIFKITRGDDCPH